VSERGIIILSALQAGLVITVISLFTGDLRRGGGHFPEKKGTTLAVLSFKHYTSLLSFRCPD